MADVKDQGVENMLSSKCKSDQAFRARGRMVDEWNIVRKALTKASSRLKEDEDMIVWIANPVGHYYITKMSYIMAFSPRPDEEKRWWWEDVKKIKGPPKT